MAVGVEYHGGLGGIGIENTMVDGVKTLEVTQVQYQGVRRKRACEVYFEETFQLLQLTVFIIKQFTTAYNNKNKTNDNNCLCIIDFEKKKIE